MEEKKLDFEKEMKRLEKALKDAEEKVEKVIETK